MTNWNKRKFRPRKVLFFMTMAVLFCMAIGYVVMLLWNWLMPDLFNLKPINWWQAIGLFVLFRILFGGFKGGSRGKYSQKRKQWQNKWMQMDDTERAQMKEKWRDYCKKRDA